MKIKQSLKRISIGLLIGLFTVTALFVPSNQADAAGIDQAPTAGLYLNARWVDSVVKCTAINNPDSRPALKSTLTESEYKRMDIFKTSGSKTGLIVGHDLEYGGGLSGDDGKATCDELVLPAIAPVSEAFGSTSAFIDYFYSKSGSEYQLKGQLDRASSTGLLLGMPFVAGNNSGDIRRARLAVAFSECFKESTTGSSDISGLSKDFIYVNGKDGGTNIDVGLGQIGGSSEKLSCSTLANLAKPSEEDLVKLMEETNVNTGILRNNPQNIYGNLRANDFKDVAISTARTQIFMLLGAKPNVVAFCLTSAGLPTNIGIQSITEWLVTGNYEDNLIYSGAGRGISATQQQAANLKSCLLNKDALGDELGPVLDALESSLEVIDEDLANNTAENSESTADSDVCLSEGDNFISWMACPLINLLNDGFDKIKDTLQDMMQFSIEDEGPNTAANVNELKNAWNLFRGLASILIIIFFLTALLVKSIRGE